jgi:hypothetical protein
MLLSVLLFSLNDALGKWLVATFSGFQTTRGARASRHIRGTLLPFVVRAGPGAFRPPRQPLLQVARVALSTAEVGCFYLVRLVPAAGRRDDVLPGSADLRDGHVSAVLKEGVGNLPLERRAGRLRRRGDRVAAVSESLSSARLSRLPVHVLSRSC